MQKSLEIKGKTQYYKDKKAKNGLLNDFGENIKLVKIKTPEYPYLLEQIHAPPPLLYYKGVLPVNTFNIAIVGSRKMTSYGKAAIEKILLPLTGKNVCIVSGLAYGVDAHAHKIALKTGLKTIAVLGSGIDDTSIYPADNLPLAKEIMAARGAIMSEFKPGTRGLRFHFPLRNRIISGLSRAVVVIEAASKSGALITAYAGLQQNRDIFALPGSIFEPLSEGTNNLIKNGAKPLTDANDLFIEYPELLRETT